MNPAEAAMRGDQRLSEEGATLLKGDADDTVREAAVKSRGSMQQRALTTNSERRVQQCSDCSDLAATTATNKKKTRDGTALFSSC